MRGDDHHALPHALVVRTHHGRVLQEIHRIHLSFGRQWILPNASGKFASQWCLGVLVRDLDRKYYKRFD